jgi:alpha-beta hydrolase superfamily lysophospholipase
MSNYECELKIKTPDKKFIYGTLGLPKKKTSKLVIFVHGLASTELWPTMLLASWYFRQRGYAYFRINLYDWRKGARTLMSSDLKQHALDTITAVKYLKRLGYKNIYAVGHSFGGLTLLRSDTSNFKAISLWDCSSFIEYNPVKRIKYLKKTKHPYMPGSYELAMSERYINGMKNFPNELDLISKIIAPTQICYADGRKGMLIKSSKRYYKSLSAPKELVPIKNSSHSFTEEGIGEVLFKNTKAWFDKF